MLKYQKSNKAKARREREKEKEQERETRIGKITLSCADDHIISINALYCLLKLVSIKLKVKKLDKSKYRDSLSETIDVLILIIFFLFSYITLSDLVTFIHTNYG